MGWEGGSRDDRRRSHDPLFGLWSLLLRVSVLITELWMPSGTFPSNRIEQTGCLSSKAAFNALIVFIVHFVAP